MAHATLKLVPGVDTNRTLALNEAALSDTNLVRFVPDKQGLCLVQKLGGWTRFFPSSVGSTVRALWAWQDTNSQRYLALGAVTRVAVTAGATGNGTTATLTCEGSATFSVGETIKVAGVTPTGYNGVYTITATTSNTVSFASSQTGAQTVAGTISSTDALSIISSGTRQILTPTTQEQNVAVSATTTAGSSTVEITASGSQVTAYDTVQIKTQIAVGGLVLFGLYPALYVDGANKFQIIARDALGAPQNAASSVTSGGAVPQFAFTSGDAIVNVTLANHGYVAGDSFPILVPLTAAGITLSGNYSVISVTSSSVFKIRASSAAGSTTTASLNGGQASYVYYKTPGPLATGTGYGVGGYGVGGYGVGAPGAPSTSAIPISAVNWTLDNWGETLLACPVGGAIYSWSPTSGQTQGSILSGAPPVNDGMFVAMPQRQVVAWGSTFSGVQDQLLIRWSDVNNYNSWIALPANQAGSYRIPKGSKIVGCIQGPQQGLVWTDLSIWAMQYVGPPYVYQFNEIGTGCGLIARRAATSMNGIVYWMGQSQFYRLSNSGVETIPCPIWDVIFQDIDRDNLDKVLIAANSRFGEIAWFYPTTASGGEIGRYVKYNVALNAWDFGEMIRTAWINESVLGPPIGAGFPAADDGERLIYQHETSTDADGTAMNSWFKTGYSVISEGEMKVFVDQVWPDMRWGYYDGDQNADLLMTFNVTDYPTSTPRVYGPYAINSTKNFLTPRFRGRLVSVEIESNDIGSFWRLGAMRYRYAGDGKF